MFIEKNTHWLVILLVLSLQSALSYAQINIVTDRQEAMYDHNTNMVFKVTSNESGMVYWKLKYDNYTTIKENSFYLEAGQTKTIPHNEKTPGIALCEVRQNDHKDMAAAAFSPYQIQPFTGEPSDFDAFWNTQKSKLAQVAMQPQVSFYSETEKSTTYNVRLNNIDGKKVYAYMTIPKGEGPFPAMLVFPSFGSQANLVRPETHLAESGGVIAIGISIHDSPLNQTATQGYKPNIFTNREQNYFKHGILGAVQMINYLFTRSEFDKQNIATTGASQGAGLALIVAGLDKRVNLLTYSGPILTQTAGQHFGKANGFPNYIHEARQKNWDEWQTIEATKYYDAMYFARRYKGPMLAAIGYADDVTPAATAFASLNQFRSQQPCILVHGVKKGHVHPNEFWQGRIDMIHQFYPTTQNVDYAKTGYAIEAGTHQKTSVGQTITLKGQTQKDNVVQWGYTPQWSKRSGVGNATFSKENSFETTVTFDQPGYYELQFTAIDKSMFASNGYYVTLMDYVGITVEGAATDNNHCEDKDKDGICVSEDCDDNNAQLPAAVGSSCDDKNEATKNDVIQADGCTCLGEIEDIDDSEDNEITTNCETIISTEIAKIIIENINDPIASVELYDQSFQLIWKCNPWEGNPCTATTIIDNLKTGSYTLSLETFTDAWDERCDILKDFEVEGNQNLIEGTTSLELSEATASTIKLFPNPATSYLTVDFGNTFGDISQLIVSNMLGQTVFEQWTPNERIVELNINEYQKGVYTVLFVQKNGERETKRFLVVD